MKETDMRGCVWWLWKVAGNVRVCILLSAMAGILRVAVSLCMVWIGKRLVDMAVGSVGGEFSVYIVGMCACIALQLALSVFRERQDGVNGVSLRNELRYHYFAHLMRSRWWGKEKYHTGDMVNRLQEDVRVVSDLVCVTFLAVLVTVVQLVGAFVLMVSLDGKMAWAIFFIMPVALLTGKNYLLKMKGLTGSIRSCDAKVQEYVQEKIQNRILIGSLGRTLGVVQGLGPLQESFRRQVVRRIDFSLLSRIFVQIGFVSGYTAAFLWGIFGLRDGSVSFGMMTAFLQLVSQVQRPVVDLGRYFSGLVHVTASVERLHEWDALSVEEQGEVFGEGKVGIRLEKVSFRYPDGKRKVIGEFSYDFVPGSVTMVVGETGAGKSTLIRLMLALLFPEAGKVALYNDKGEEMPVSPLTRCNFVYVPQGNTLMSGTIRENLLLENPAADEEEMRRALYIAAAGFVFDLPEGLDTYCGEKGGGLSEGQVQRIAIARGLLHSGSILLLDEPTSALDGETERLLMERLTAQLENKTLILITHRIVPVDRKVEVIRLER